MSEYWSLTSYISIRRHPTGRRAYTLKEMLDRAAELELHALAGEIERALKKERKTVRLEVRWEGARKRRSSRRGEAAVIDNKLDAAVGHIERVAQSHAAAEDEEDPQSAAARRLLDAGYPAGLAAITLQSFEVQLERVVDLEDILTNELEAEVRLLGLEAKVRRMGELARAFRKELEKHPKNSLVTFDEVREAREQGYLRFVGILAYILGTFRSNSEEHVKIRKALLFEFHHQDMAVVEARRRRRQVVDVDPETGEEVAPDEFELDDGEEQDDDAA